MCYEMKNLMVRHKYKLSVKEAPDEPKTCYYCSPWTPDARTLVLKTPKYFSPQHLEKISLRLTNKLFLLASYHIVILLESNMQIAGEKCH